MKLTVGDLYRKNISISSFEAQSSMRFVSADKYSPSQMVNSIIRVVKFGDIVVAPCKYSSSKFKIY